MKDFFDLWVLTKQSELDSATLARAITATFARRGTRLPTATPIGLSDEFATDATKQTQWRAFVQKTDSMHHHCRRLLPTSVHSSSQPSNRRHKHS